MALNKRKASHALFIVYRDELDKNVDQQYIRQAFNTYDMAKAYADLYTNSKIEMVYLNYTENHYYFSEDDKL